MVALAAMLWALDLILRPKAQASGLTDPQIVLFEHLALAAIFIPSLIKHRDEWRRISRRGWLGLGFIAIFGSAIATILISMAYRSGSPLLTALLQKTQPIFAIVLAGLFLGEQRKPFFWPLFAGALGGTYLLAFGLTPIGFSSATLPILYALCAAAIWGMCTVVGRMAIENQRSPVIAGWRFILALPFLLTLNLVTGQPAATSSIHVASLVPVLLIVIFPDALGMLLYYAGLKRTPASLATLAELTFPVTALILSLFDQKQSLNFIQWIGLVVLIGCLHTIQTSGSVSTKESSLNSAT